MHVYENWLVRRIQRAEVEIFRCNLQQRFDESHNSDFGAEVVLSL
jgi:hypothetical protein